MTNNGILKLQQNLKNDEAFIVYYGPNRFYLTGFNSSAGVVVITPKSADFIILCITRSLIKTQFVN